jgi:hypothetical protein
MIIVTVSCHSEPVELRTANCKLRTTTLRQAQGDNIIQRINNMIINRLINCLNIIHVK